VTPNKYIYIFIRFFIFDIETGVGPWRGAVGIFIKKPIEILPPSR
jgi:hypothetical protein